MDALNSGEKKQLNVVDYEDVADIYALDNQFSDESDAELLQDVLDVGMPRSEGGTDWTCSKTHCSFAPNLCFDI